MPCSPMKPARLPSRARLGVPGGDPEHSPRPAQRAFPQGFQGTSVVQTLVHCTFLETEVNMTSDT